MIDTQIINILHINGEIIPHGSCSTMIYVVDMNFFRVLGSSVKISHETTTFLALSRYDPTSSLLYAQNDVVAV